MKFRLISFSFIILTNNQIYPANLATLLENLKQELTVLHEQLIKKTAPSLFEQQEAAIEKLEQMKEAAIGKTPLFYTKAYPLPEPLDRVTPKLLEKIESRLPDRARPDLQFVPFTEANKDEVFRDSTLIFADSGGDASNSIKSFVSNIKSDAILVLYVHEDEADFLLYVHEDEADFLEDLKKDFRSLAQADNVLITFVIKRASVPEGIEPSFILSEKWKEHNDEQLSLLKRVVGRRYLAL